MTLKRFKLAPLPPKLKEFAGTLAKYTPLLRTGARLASFAGHALHLKPLRDVGQVLRAVHLAASLAKGFQQVKKLAPQPKGPSGGSSPSPSPKGPRPGPSFGRLPPRPPAPKPLPSSPRAPKPAQNRPQHAPGSPTAPKPWINTLGPPPAGSPAAFPSAKPSPLPPGVHDLHETKDGAFLNPDGSVHTPAPSAPRAPAPPPARAAKTVARLAAPTMLKRFPMMPGAERRTPARMPGGVGDADGGEREGLAGLGKGFGGGFGGSDGPGLGGDSDGGADGMGGNVAEILQTISQNLSTLLDIAKANGMTPEGGKDAPGMPGGSDAMQGAQKIIDTLESGKAQVSQVDTGIAWARALGPLIEGVMAAGAPVGI